MGKTQLLLISCDEYGAVRAWGQCAQLSLSLEAGADFQVVNILKYTR